MNEVKVKVNTVLTSIPKLLSYEIVAEPLWADDTGRNTRTGKFTGTFKGYFTNINLEIGATTQAEYTTLCSMFQKSTSPTCTVSYPLESTGNLKEEDFYGVALKAKKDRYTGKYNSLTIQLVAINKR